MGDIHVNQQQRQQDPLYQHHVESFKQLDSVYRENMDTHKDFMSEYDQQHQDEKHTDRVNAPVEKKWGKTYVSKLKNEEQSMTSTDRERLKTKERLSEIIELDKVNLDLRLGGLSSEFKDVLSAITAYTKINANAVEGDYKAEQAALLNAMQMNMKFIITMQIKQQEKGLSAAEKGMLNRAIQYDKFFSAEHDGNLEIPRDAVVNHTEDKDIVCKEKFTDKTKQLLFPHDPCVNDIHQGGLGDCYLLAGLASIVATQPMKIKECMRDNNDGTVTVRFFREVDADNMTPVYVKVKKTTPDGFSHNSLWVQMIEKAYTASQLHEKEFKLANKTTRSEVIIKHNERLTADIARRERTMKDAVDGLKTGNLPEEAKAIFNREIEQMRVEIEQMKKEIAPKSYEDIDGGLAGVFIQRLLGQEHRQQVTEYQASDFDGLKMVKTRVLASTNDIQPGNVIYENTTASLMKSKYGYDGAPADPQEETEYRQKQTIVKRRLNDIVVRVQMSIISETRKQVNEQNFSKAVQSTLDELQKTLKDKTDDDSDIDRQAIELLKQKYKELGTNEYEKCKPLSGEYSKPQLDEFERLKTALAAGKIISAGTRKFDSTGKGLNGETAGGGLYGTHAYTVLGTETRQVSTDGTEKTFHFLKIRNPWGSSIEQYSLKDGKLKEHSDDSGVNNGIFLVELNRFISVYRHVDIN